LNTVSNGFVSVSEVTPSVHPELNSTWPVFNRSIMLRSLSEHYQQLNIVFIGFVSVCEVAPSVHPELESTWRKWAMAHLEFIDDRTRCPNPSARTSQNELPHRQQVSKLL
jgi:hypothetical protein